LRASGENWLDAITSDVAAVRAAMQPGVVNEVLLDKLKTVLDPTDKYRRIATWQALMSEMRPEDALAVEAILDELEKEGR